MKWKELFERYPLAFLEWAKSHNETVTEIHEFVLDNVCLTDCGNVVFGSHDLIYLPYYFEKHGISIIPTPFVIGDSKERTWCVCSFIDFKWQGYFMDERQIKVFPDRLTATIEGVKKAFEIREEVLRNQKES